MVPNRPSSPAAVYFAAGGVIGNMKYLLILFLALTTACATMESQSARVQAARLQVGVLLKYSENVKRKTGDYPSHLEPLDDPWGEPYTSTLTGNRLRICSLGPDGRAETADDICAASSGIE
jgi:hypothetical protein